MEVTWQAPEFEFYAKGPTWYWSVIVTTVVLVGIALLTSNFLFAVFAVLAAGVVLFWAGRKPRELTFTVLDSGLRIAGGEREELYPYKTFSSFALLLPTHAWEHFSELVLLRPSSAKGHVKIFFPTREAPQLREALSARLREVDYEETFLDHLIRLSRF